MSIGPQHSFDESAAKVQRPATGEPVLPTEGEAVDEPTWNQPQPVPSLDANKRIDEDKDEEGKEGVKDTAQSETV